jgi:heptaprenyl diphosphate synthase
VRGMSPAPSASLGALRLAVDDPGLEARVVAGLEATEVMLREVVASDYPFVTETSRHLVDAGGKRFRPLLTLLAAELGAPEAPGVVPAAVAVELTHLSTLYHDDVMDEAVVRRGAQAANARWTNTVAILTGDFLFARASEVIADLGPEPTRILARTIGRLCEGQMRETVGPAEASDPVDHYLQVVSEKTGSLLATSGRLGALLAGADAAVVDVLRRYGEVVGIAFQVSDDLIDVSGEVGDSGKTPGTDLREGVPTLPVLLALRDAEAGDADAARIAESVSVGFGGPDGEARLAEALTLLRGSKAMDRSREILATYADEASRMLATLPEGSARTALEALAGFVVKRTG